MFSSYYREIRKTKEKEKVHISRMANVFIAYILWLVGGGVGLHHFYLGRDRQAFIWWATFGGCFGAGWFRDLWRIPEYIFAANKDEGYIKDFLHKRTCYKSPPFCPVRFCGELILGCCFGFLARLCVPEENAYEGIGWLICVIVPPCAVALGKAWVLMNYCCY